MAYYVSAIQGPRKVLAAGPYHTLAHTIAAGLCLWLLDAAGVPTLLAVL